MTGRDAERFGELLNVVADMYDRRVSPGQIVLWFRALERYEFETIQQAFNKFLQSSDSKRPWPILPAHIRDIIEGSDADRDAAVWVTLESAIRRIGNYASVIVEDPFLATAITMTFGGWHQACAFRMRGDEIAWTAKRRDFTSMYRIARQREAPSREPRLLAGQCEAENRLSGYFPKHGVYGVIRLDGTTEYRYLDVDAGTGYPALEMRAALALPPLTAAMVRAALPAHDEAPPMSREDFEKQLRAYASRRTIPTSAPVNAAIADAMERDDYADRVSQLQQQARVINADSGAHGQTGESVLTQENGESIGRRDRTPDLGGGAPGGRAGVLLRESDRPELAGGSGVAGVSDPVRAGRGSVRQRGALRAGKLDDKAKRNGPSEGDVRRVDKRTTRRKA